MLHKIIITFCLLSLANCQNQKKTTEVETNSPKPVVTTQNTSTPKGENEIEMSVGLPPDKEAIKTAEEEEKIKSEQNGTIYLKEGENKFLKEYGMNITFKRITEDSRCPKDVNCVWEGAATAEIEVMGLETRPMILKISTVNQGQKYSKVQQFNGYDISLDQLSPETTSEKGMKQLQGKYKIALKINKAGTNSSPTR